MSPLCAYCNKEGTHVVRIRHNCGYRLWRICDEAFCREQCMKGICPRCTHYANGLCTCNVGELAHFKKERNQSVAADLKEPFADAVPQNVNVGVDWAHLPKPPKPSATREGRPARRFKR